MKTPKNITQLWCKIVPKISVTQIKNNVKRTIFIYT